MSPARRLGKDERTAAARAPGRELSIRPMTVIVPNRDILHSTQLPLYVRVSVAAVGPGDRS